VICIDRPTMGHVISFINELRSHRRTYSTEIELILDGVGDATF
jgi:hypothetical protein